MIGLMVMGVFLAYILLSLFIVWMAYKVFKTKKALFIALLIMILIPTWDVIIGKPIYNYLCKNKAGVHIYKTVDNVEGFYIGERSKRYEPYEPYEGYKYVDYKEKESGKYYRSYWVDNNTSKNCVPIGKAKYGDYAKAFHHGKCIVKKEISERDVSRWDISWNKKEYTKIFPLNLKIVKVGLIKDSITNETLSEQFTIDWNGGWVYGILSSIERGHPENIFCGIDYSNVFELEYKTLKSKKEGEK